MEAKVVLRNESNLSRKAKPKKPQSTKSLITKQKFRFKTLGNENRKKVISAVSQLQITSYWRNCVLATK